jgi:hypothetical protein
MAGRCHVSRTPALAEVDGYGPLCRPRDRVLADDDRHVTGIDCTQEPPEPCGELTITLEPGSYELRPGEIAVGSGSSREGPAYLTDIEGSEASIPETGRQRIVVGARDRFDNPTSGVAVTGTLDGDAGTLQAVTPVSESDGRAVFVYEAPGDVDGSRTVTVTTQFDEGDQQRTVTAGIQVFDIGGTGDESDGGSTTAAAIQTVEGSVDSRNIGGSDRGRDHRLASRDRTGRDHRVLGHDAGRPRGTAVRGPQYDLRR